MRNRTNSQAGRVAGIVDEIEHRAIETLVGTARKGRYGHRSQRHSVHADKQPGLKWHHDVQYRQLGDIAGNRPHATRWG
jgi:hypothetical protein